MATDTHSSEQAQDDGGGDAPAGASANGQGSHDWGVVQAHLLDRARALQPGNGGAVDTLINDIVTSIVPPSTFDGLAKAIGKANGLDPKVIKNQLDMGRANTANGHDEANEEEDFVDYEPDETPVSLKAIADLVRGQFDEWIDAPGEHLDFMILWSLGTWGLSPGCTARQFRKRGGVYLYAYLWLSSVDTDSGKSTALRSLQAIVRRPMSIGRITPAALFRDLEALQRCGLVDEIGDLLKLYPDIASLLEMACYRDGEVKLTEAVSKKGHEKRIVVKFRLFGPLAVASVERGGIEAGRNTLRSRSVRLRMIPSKKKQMLSLEDHARAVSAVADAVGPHLAAHADAIRETMEDGPSTPLPAILRNRRRDVWVHFFAIAELLGGDWPERCLAVCKLLEQTGKSPAVSDARDCLDAMQACQAERQENYTEAMNAAWPAAVAVARKHLPALSDPALTAVGWAAAASAGLTGRRAVQAARTEAAALGVPVNVLDDCTAAGLEAARADDLASARFTYTNTPAGWHGYNTVRAGYDPNIPMDFLPTLHFLDWLTTNHGAQFACANAGPAGRPITATKLGRLLGDVVKGEDLRKRQGGRRVQLRGWSVGELAKVWAEEERATEIP